MKIVSFVILHYKDIKITDQCVQSILKMEHQERIQIVVVDNDVAESRENREKLRKLYEPNQNITVLQILENGGFSYANNKGYAYARERLNAEYILVLNNDIEFTQIDFIDRLDKAYAKSRSHIFAPDIIRCCTGEHQNPVDTRIRTKEEAEYTIRMNYLALKWYPVLYPLLWFWNRRAENASARKQKKDTSWYMETHSDIVPFGACLIYTPAFVEKEACAFEPETQFYYEEYILALRCMRKKYSICYEPDMKMLHESGAATKKSKKNEYKRLRFVMQQTLEACRVYTNFLEKDHRQQEYRLDE